MLRKTKTKPDKLRYTLLDGSGATLFDGAPEDLRFPDAVLKELSIEYFNDPNPCYIHLGAVSDAVLLQLREVLAAPGDYAAADLPKEICRYLSAYAFTVVRVTEA